MKLDNYSIDDLHQLTLAEFAEDQDAQAVFRSIYEAMKKNYIAARKLMEYRTHTEERSQAS